MSRVMYNLSSKYAELTMPFNAKILCLIEAIHSPEALLLNIKAIHHLIQKDISQCTIAERFELLEKIEFLAAHVTSPIEKQFMLLKHIILGLPKPYFLTQQAFFPQASYQVSGKDLLILSEYYKQKGVVLYVEGFLPKNLQIQPTVSNKQSNPQRAILEMTTIQASLQEGDYVGYLYNNGAKKGIQHIECFIISPHRIIKPVQWHVIGRDIDLQVYIPHSPQSDLFFLCQQHIIPQADTLACGTLALLNLVTYLKDNAAQLHEYTLAIPLYVPQLRYLFIPSPHILRYSQCSSYNRYIEALFAEEDSEMDYKINQKEPLKLKVRCLKTLLQDSFNTAKFEKNNIVLEEIMRIKELLPTFSSRWKNAYAISLNKRNAMTLPSNTQNQYLCYKSHRMHNCSLNIYATQKYAPVLFPWLDNPVSVTPITISSIISQLPSSKHIGYFLSRLNAQTFQACLEEALKAIFNYQLGKSKHHDLEKYDNFITILPYLKLLQKEALIDYMREPPHFIALIFPITNPYYFSEWFQTLGISPGRHSHFLTRVMSINLAVELKKYVESGMIGNLKFLFSDDHELACFLYQVLDEAWLINLIPLYLKEQKLHFLRVFFENTPIKSDGLIRSFKSESLLALIQQKTKISEIYTLLGSCCTLLHSANKQLLDDMVTPELCAHLFNNTPLSESSILFKYFPARKELFMRTYQVIIIKALVSAEHYQLYSIMQRIGATIDFWCPKDDPGILTTYQHIFSNLLAARTQQFLAYFIKEFQMTDRLILIQRILKPTQQDFLPSCITQLLPAITISHDASNELSLNNKISL